VKRKPLVVRVVVDRRAAELVMAAVAVAALAMRLSSETLTLTTTYPAPVGVYNQIVTTGNSGTAPADTTLARNAGNVILAPASNADGRVGIGVSAPLAKLDVDGTVRVGAFPSDPASPAPSPGVVYYNTSSKTIRLYTGSWGDLGGSPQGGFCGFASNPGFGTLNFPCMGADLSTGACPKGFTLVPLGAGTTCVKN
jgi:hypothetical protein